MKNQTNSAWTPELRERVKALWVNQSGAEIAWTLHAEGYTFSRNAIIGFLHRALGSAKRVDLPRKRPKPRSDIKQVRAAPRISQTEIKLRCVEIVCATPFEDVTGCRYPEGDGPFLFCNGDRKAGSSYCVPHLHLTSGPPRPRLAQARVYQGTDFARSA